MLVDTVRALVDGIELVRGDHHARVADAGRPPGGRNLQFLHGAARWRDEGEE
jgi:hypothetical protein